MHIPHSRCFILLSLLVSAAACREEADLPSAPASRPSLAAATAALTYWQVSAGGTHTCAITTDDRVWCWGANGFGELGDGTTAAHFQPALVAGAQRFRQMSSGDFGTCALATDDRVFCWGAAFLGFQASSPQAVGGTLRFRQVSNSGEHACAIGRDDGRAYCWGWNQFGQLGDGAKATGAVRPRRPSRALCASTSSRAASVTPAASRPPTRSTAGARIGGANSATTPRRRATTCGPPA